MQVTWAYQQLLCCRFPPYTVCQDLWKLVSVCRNYSRTKKLTFLDHRVQYTRQINSSWVNIYNDAIWRDVKRFSKKTFIYRPFRYRSEDLGWQMMDHTHISNVQSRWDTNSNTITNKEIFTHLLTILYLYKNEGIIDTNDDDDNNNNNNNNRLTAFVPGQPGWAGTRRNTLPSALA